MASKEVDRKNKKVISAQNMLDHAPTKGGKSYLKLPEGLKYFLPAEGRTYQLVFLPWKAGRGNYAAKGEWTTNRFFYTHRGIGPNDETFVCSQKTFGKPCAVCEKYAALRPTGNGDDFYKKVLEPLKFRVRELFFVHDLGGDPKNLMVWDESSFLFGDHLRERMSLRKKYSSFADFEEGYNLMIKGKKKQIGAGSCTEFSTIEFEERDPLPEWLQKAAEKYCLDDCVVETPYDKLKKLVTSAHTEEEEEPEIEPENEEPEEEPEEEHAPRRTGSARSGSKARKPAPEPEEEEDEVEEPSDLDEEEDEIEEEEDLDEEPEDEDEPPAKPVRRPRR